MALSSSSQFLQCLIAVGVTLPLWPTWLGFGGG